MLQNLNHTILFLAWFNEIAYLFVRKTIFLISTQRVSMVTMIATSMEVAVLEVMVVEVTPEVVVVVVVIQEVKSVLNLSTVVILCHHYLKCLLFLGQMYTWHIHPHRYSIKAQAAIQYSPNPLQNKII